VCTDLLNFVSERCCRITSRALHHAGLDSVVTFGPGRPAAGDCGCRAALEAGVGNGLPVFA